MSFVSRRTFLAGTSFALARAAAAPAKPLNVVMAGGHPGDPEYGVGGTVARYSDAGHKVVLFYLNRGEKGCSGKSAQACADLRTSEAQRACRILGATPGFFNQIDGEAKITPQSYAAFYKALRTVDPDVVFTQWPLDNHRDHRATYTFVYDAWLRAGKKFGLYFYEVSDGEDTMMFSPSDYVDISGVEKRKREACFAHASQTPERFYALQSEIANFRGKESGHRQAEAFRHHPESPGGLLP